MSSSSGTVCKPASTNKPLDHCTDKPRPELDDIVSAHCQSHDLIDNALRSYLTFTTQYKGNCGPSTAPPLVLTNLYQASTYIVKMKLLAAPTSFWHPLYSMRTETMSAGRLSILFYR